jgi:hypothetical protein
VGYYSATLNEAERNYDIYNLELLAIVKALHNWRPLLAGLPHNILSRSHKGAAGMRSVLTFEKVVWIVDARVER